MGQDTIELKGDKYLSVKKASELFNYHPDYVSFLCRTGKTKGQLLAGSWFVAHSSLLAYSNKKKYVRQKRKSFWPRIFTATLIVAICFFGTVNPALAETPPPRTIAALAKSAWVRSFPNNFFSRASIRLAQTLAWFLPGTTGRSLSLPGAGQMRASAGSSQLPPSSAETDSENKTNYLENTAQHFEGSVKLTTNNSAEGTSIKSTNRDGGEATFSNPPTPSPAPITQNITNVYPDIAPAAIDQKLSDLESRLLRTISGLQVQSSGNATYINNVYNALGQASRIDQLHGTAITDATITGGSITGAALSATSGTFSSSLSTAGSLSVSGSLSLCLFDHCRRQLHRHQFRDLDTLGRFRFRHRHSLRRFPQ